MSLNRAMTILLTTLAMVLFVSTAESARIKNVSERKTNAFLKQLEADHQKAWAEMKPALKKRNPVWIQPENKEEECKVVMIMQEGQEVPNGQFYWDGECKDGYAYGLGRAFLDSTMGLVAWLEEYGKPGELPLSYYVHYYDLKNTTIGFQNSEEPNPWNMTGSHFAFSQTVTNEDFTVSQMIFNSETGIGYGVQSGYAADQVRKGIHYANGVVMFVDVNVDPNSEWRNAYGYFDTSASKWIGYGAGVFRNGQVSHSLYEDGINIPAKLSEEFLSHLAKLETDIDAHLRKIMSYVQRGNLALEVYKRRTCSGDLDVDYMDSMLYGQICLDTGDFTPYVDQIEELKMLAEKRRASNAEIALRQKEIDAQNRAIYAQQQQAQRAASNQAMANAAQQSQQMLNNSMQLLNSMMSNSSVPALGSWGGGSQRNTAVCHVMGNVVHCR